MKIDFSEHAKERLRLRKISKNRVMETMANPDEEVGSYRLRKLLRKRYGGRILEVVTRPENNTIVVVTAYYLT